MGKLFGTFGVRGIYGEKLSEEFALKLGMAFGSFLRRFSERPRIVVGRDTRRSGEPLLRSFVSGILSTGVDVLELGILPTPLVQFAARRLGVDGGAVITASHNPPEYNGIKLLEPNGMGLSRKKEREVEEVFFEGKFFKASWWKVGRLERMNVIPIYFEEVEKRVNVESIRRRKPKVLVDEGGGAGSLVLPELLELIGCSVISINSHTSGFFSSRNPEPNPENLRDFSKIVEAISPDLAVAQDGDADRAVFLRENGEFVQGDKTFALVEKFVLMEKRGDVVTTIATSDVIDDIAKEFGVKVHRTKVGDLVVTGKLLEVNGVLGGEENGGVIFPDLVLGRDGIFTTVKIVEAISKSGKTFSELLDELPRTYQLKEKIEVERERKEIVRRFAKIMREKGYEVDETDGAKVRVEHGWVLVRASGTEPIIRIFSESRKEGGEKELFEMAKRALEEVMR